VHASGQVASAVVDVTHDAATMRRALNAMLPEAVRVLAVEDAPRAFHARFDAAAKVYEYRILNGPVASPFVQRYAWHVPWTLDLAAMREAAACLVGEHDFAAFRSAGAEVRTTVRRVFVSRVDEAIDLPVVRPAGAVPAAVVEGRLLVYVVEGSGFLRHMVRAIVGTLVEVGSGRTRPEDVARVLEARDRALAGPTAPASGLCLAAVRYEPGAVATQR
jgi:tRNA pseudouridine38-40 synthase